MKGWSYLSIALCLLLLATAARSAASGQVFALDKFLQEYAGLNAEQIDSVHRGKAVAIVLDSPTPDKVFVFGTVYVDATPDRYLRFANDFDELRKLPSYLAVQQFSNPPQLSDLDGFSMDAEDIKDLKNCNPGRCEVQLPSEAMSQFQQSVDWTADSAANQANRTAQQMVLQALLAYQKGGNEALGVYRDKDHPTRIAETFRPCWAAGTATENFNRNEDNVKLGKRISSTSTLDTWFDGGSTAELNEDVIGLGDYGKTLTVLWADSLPEPDEVEEIEEIDDENLLPSQRWRERG